MIRQHHKIIPLDIEKRQDKEPPPIKHTQSNPALKPVLVNSVARVNDVEQDVIEKRLEGRDGSAFVAEEGG